MAAHTKDKYFPPIAPGPRGPVTPSSTRVLSGSKKNSAACLPCKQAKKKGRLPSHSTGKSILPPGVIPCPGDQERQYPRCSGLPAPCRACHGAESECVFDLTLDLRRKVAQRRTVDERERYRHVLLSLLDALRSSEPTRINELINFIRSDASMSCIATALADSTINLDYFSSVDLGSNPSVEMAISSLLPPPGPSDIYSRITLENLVDIPLFQVPDKPWTNVSDNDDHVSHLMSLYFTWDHPCCQLVDQTIFLRHMKSGDLNSEYCTPFLVNSILAMASMYSDAPEIFAIPRNANTCGQHFYMEAERLWRAEEGNATLANIQGLVIMCHVLKCQGRDRVSWLMLRQAVQLAQDLGMFQAPRALQNRGKISAEMQHVRTITAWGTFMMNLNMSMELQKNANLERPVCKPCTEDNINDETVWTQYPRSNQVKCAKKPALLRCVTTELVNLTEITVNIQELFFSKAFDMDIDGVWRETKELHTLLCKWRQNLPDALEVDDYPVPQVLFLHIICHQRTLSLFNSFLDHASSKCMSHLIWVEQAKHARIPSAKDIAWYLRVLRLSYGPKRIPSHMLEATNSSLLVLLGDLEGDDSRNAFVQLFRILVVFSKRLKQAKGMALTIPSIAQQSGIVLPPEVVLILDRSESES